MRPRHFVRSCAICWYVEVFKGGFEGVLVSLLLTTMGAFFYLKFSIEDFLWQTFIRHSGNMACPSYLCQFQKSMYTLHPGNFQYICVWNPVCYLIIRSFLRQLVWKWFSLLACRWYTVQVSHAYNSVGRSDPKKVC